MKLEAELLITEEERDQALKERDEAKEECRKLYDQLVALRKSIALS